ncbi:hypothetical protein TCAL_11722 [Tigriopus californicus]|uniref:Proteasome inhibitor PI31 subunit n=1 Tax=Tigriopus californicus TaxID=6832 RepID=A0A553NFZ8_TIGCA|nr:proteasome inhibitor PI31 subunit-like [Tigriopus californicus]TRY64367.1 hypothetical protein TCAL_11722 [Tigriopus californicus]|eukprot:TCALIF_11722-PA protein Name:"Similar to PI31 Proteasome inhibitor PI31 subunit (Drosophila melanogaster)" AED:0.01 eAED:0.01 QI:0/-1/0/1/-1/1/1/0/272
MSGFGWDLVQRSTERDISTHNDVVVAFTHWKLLALGLRCVGNGDHFQAGSDPSPSELLPTDWNKDNSALYTLKYRHHETTADKYVLKAIVAGSSLILSLVRVADEQVTTLSVESEKWVDLGDKNVLKKDELAKTVDKELLDPIFKPSSETEAKAEEAKGQSSSRLRDESQGSSSGLRVGGPRGPLRRDDLLLGSSDLDPLGRMGGPGMVFEPGNFMAPPRARFDPVHPYMPNPGMGGPMGPGMGGPMGPGIGRRRFGDEMQPPGFDNDDMFG